MIPPMCCSTGVCGPSADPELARCAADLKWLEKQGVAVERFNPTLTPVAFAEDDMVCSLLMDKGQEALPLVVVDGEVVASALNLRKLRPGFERLAKGEKEPDMPKVWCPVLTMATRAAADLCESVAVKSATGEDVNV